MTTVGRAWCFGDDVDTDAILASSYLRRADRMYWAAHIFEGIRAELPLQVCEGDYVVAGRGFGSGSAREHAAVAVRAAGVRAIVAESFSRNFFRNAFNCGLPALEIQGICAAVHDGDQLAIDLNRGQVSNLSTGATIEGPPIPTFLLEMCEAGGLGQWLKGNQLVWSVR